MRRAVLGVWNYLQYFTVLLLFLPIFAVTRLLHRRDPLLRWPGKIMRIFGRITGTLTPLWHFTNRGSPPADVHERAYVVISNHESTADIFLLTRYRWDMKWIAKQELFNTPFVGWILRMSGDIPIKRGDRESVKRMMQACRDALRRDMPVMLFPEGTRSKTGRLLPFKDGAFQLAIETGSPILPIAIAGTKTCMPKHSVWFGDARAIAQILAPISVEGMTMDDVPKLKAIAHERMQAAADALQKELGMYEEASSVETFSVDAALSAARDRPAA